MQVQALLTIIGFGILEVSLGLWWNYRRRCRTNRISGKYTFIAAMGIIQVTLGVFFLSQIPDKW